MDKQGIKLDKCHEVMLHGHPSMVLGFLSFAYTKKYLDLYSVEIQKPLTVCTCDDNGIRKIPESLCLRLVGQALKKDDYEYFYPMIFFMHKMFHKVIVKMDMTGYEIDEFCKIIDEWELDDGMC